MPSLPSIRKVRPEAPTALPLYSVQASRDIERAALASAPPHALMQRAGHAVARLALAIAPHAHRIWVAAGPGNNGGDGLYAALHLQAAGKQVDVSLFGVPAQLPPDARQAHADALTAGVRILDASSPHQPYDLAIDALLGLGANRAATGDFATAIAELNAQHSPVLAVDLPSGLHADDGYALGGLAVQASHTLCLLTLKPGLFTAQGRDHAGTVWWDALGMASDAAATTMPDAWLGPDDDLHLGPALRRHAQHKGSFGDVLAIGGAPGMEGAVRLAALAALRAGAGRVFVDPLSATMSLADTPELMIRPGVATHDIGLLERATVVCGCGGGTSVVDVLPTVLRHARRLVLDADALNAIAGDAALRTLLIDRESHQQPSLLTPHPLEAARLLGSAVQQVQSGRFAAAQALAEELRCAVLLKGSGSICAAPGCTPIVNPTGNALLATAGTGDVLAGWSGGLWAQRQDASTPHQAQAVAASAAWLHGRAADAAADEGRLAPLTASSLIEAMVQQCSR